MNRPRSCWRLFLVVAGWLIGAAFAAAQSPPLAPQLAPSQPPPAIVSADPDLIAGSADGFRELLTEMVLEHLPHKYEDWSKWGKTKKAWAGIKFRREGLKLETERRWKEVNDGEWEMYRVRLADPDSAFTVESSNFRDLGDGRAAFDVDFASRLRLFARQARWARDVQLYSISMQGEAEVRLRLSCTMRMHLDPSRLPPDVIFQPHVENAKITLDDFRVERISQLHGPIARELGDASRGLLQRKIDKKSDKLVDKINKQIAKKQDRLKVSLVDLAKSKWSKLAEMVQGESKEEPVELQPPQ